MPPSPSLGDSKELAHVMGLSDYALKRTALIGLGFVLVNFGVVLTHGPALLMFAPPLLFIVPDRITIRSDGLYLRWMFLLRHRTPWEEIEGAREHRDWQEPRWLPAWLLWPGPGSTLRILRRGKRAFAVQASKGVRDRLRQGIESLLEVRETAPR